MKFEHYRDDVLMSQISGDRFTVSYRIHADEKEALDMAKTMCVEQTVEFPAEHIECDAIQSDIIGKVEEFKEISAGTYRAIISYASENTGEDFPQFLNTVFGNSSLLPDITVERIGITDKLKKLFPGPRLGVPGLREKLGAYDRPLSFTALKPLGLPTEALAEEAYRCALGGIDLIKDDHGLMNQSFSEYRDRVKKVAAAVRKANEETGGNTIYVPNLSGSFSAMIDRISAAEEYGAGGVMFAPGLVGFDMFYYASRHTNLVVVGHPAFIGCNIDRGKGGIDVECLIGQLPRLAGADIMVYPNFGGRFSFSEEQCRGIQEMALCDMGSVKPMFVAPAGGMKVEKIDMMKNFYGNDVVLLIGGSLFTSPGGLTENCKKFKERL